VEKLPNEYKGQPLRSTSDLSTGGVGGSATDVLQNVGLPSVKALKRESKQKHKHYHGETVSRSGTQQALRKRAILAN